MSLTAKALKLRYPDYDAKTHSFTCPTHGFQTLDARAAYRLAHYTSERCCPLDTRSNNLPAQAEEDWPKRLNDAHPGFVLRVLYRNDTNNLVADVRCPNGHQRRAYLMPLLASRTPCPFCKGHPPRPMRPSPLTLIKKFE